MRRFDPHLLALLVLGLGCPKAFVPGEPPCEADRDCHVEQLGEDFAGRVCVAGRCVPGEVEGPGPEGGGGDAGSEGGGDAGREGPAGPVCLLMSIETDSDADGVLESRRSYTYDNEGRRLSDEFDLWGDTVPEERVLYRYDERGNLLAEEHDSDADGLVDYQYINTYDDQNNRSQRGFDAGADGEIDSLTTYTYDARGNRLSEESDEDLTDGIKNHRITYSYDERNNRLTEAQDYAADGGVDWLTTWTYDEADRVLTELIEFSGSSRPEKTVWHYDERGNMLLRESGMPNHLDQDWPDEVLRSSYNELDQRTREALSSCSGSVCSGPRSDLLWSRVYRYDDAGNRSEIDVDEDGDTALDLREYYAYDAHGNRLSHEVDEEIDEEIDSRVRYQWACD